MKIRNILAAVAPQGAFGLKNLFVVAVMACLVWLCLSHDQAHAACTAPCTKSQITSDINTNWPDNTAGQITPALLRSTVLELVNSYMDINGASSFVCPTHQWLAAIATLSSYTCSQPSAADLSNGTTGSGAAVLATSPTISNPTFTGSVTSTADNLFGSGRPWCDIRAKGAVGNNASLDTAGVTSCITTLSALGGGIMYIPPATSCYLINALNATATNNITVQGAGKASCLEINGVDSASNWWDLSGSNGWAFRDLYINNNGSTVPKVAFLWACTGNASACSTSGSLYDLSFNNVGGDFKTSVAALYGYGFGTNGLSGIGGSLSRRHRFDRHSKSSADADQQKPSHQPAHGRRFQ
jgi:hypothetical protein